MSHWGDDHEELLAVPLLASETRGVRKHVGYIWETRKNLLKQLQKNHIWDQAFTVEIRGGKLLRLVYHSEGYFTTDAPREMLELLPNFTEHQVAPDFDRESP